MLKGKLAIITGCKRGIGNSIVKVFAENKANIIACARKKDKNFVKECSTLSKRYKVKIDPFFFDLGDELSVKDQVSKIINKYKKIDILVNNAGDIFSSIFQMTSIEKFKKIFQVNFFSPILIMQLVLKNMVLNKGGSIINLSSISVKESNEGRSAYSSSKSALLNISKTISREVGRYNIRVNCVAPGLIDTDMLNLNTKKNIIEDKISTSSLKRLGSPKEVANVILFLASDLSKYVTGETIKIDGGM